MAVARDYYPIRFSEMQEVDDSTWRIMSLIPTCVDSIALDVINRKNGFKHWVNFLLTGGNHIHIKSTTNMELALHHLFL